MIKLYIPLLCRNLIFEVCQDKGRVLIVQQTQYRKYIGFSIQYTFSLYQQQRC